MGNLLRQLEVNKLARVLNIEPESVAVLMASEPAEIQAFRLIVTGRLFSQNARQVAALAQLSKKVPAPISAKVAEAAFGALLSARIAGALDPADAGKLASLLSPDFLAQVSRDLDPGRVAALIHELPKDLIVKVGHMLLLDGDTIALARFVATVSPDVALAVVAGADGAQLLEIALYVDDRSAMDPIIAEFSDERLAGVVAATKGFMGASDAEVAEAAAALVGALSAETGERWMSFADQASPAVAKAVTAAIAASK